MKNVLILVVLVTIPIKIVLVVKPLNTDLLHFIAAVQEVITKLGLNVLPVIPCV